MAENIIDSLRGVHTPSQIPYENNHTTLLAAGLVDYKKSDKELYSTKAGPALIKVPKLSFVTVEGKGDPNEADGEYAAAIGVLYSIQYTIKMSKKEASTPTGYFDYVVPPLEGLWWYSDGSKGRPVDKSLFNWLSMIRLPDFVTREVFSRAQAEAARKKKVDTSKAALSTFTEGLCVQCLHTGPYDDEPRTVALMEKYMADNGLAVDITDKRRHHEIYLSDPRKTDQAKMKTILRIPVK